MNSTETTSESARSMRATLAGLSLTMLMASLGTSIANVALPELADAFAAPFQQVQWVVLAYLLAITTLIVSVGRAGDVFGRRRLLVAGVGVFTAASVAAGLAPSLAMLVAARAAQGAGAAILMATAMALVRDAVPASRTGAAMGLLGTMSATGTALGPSLGGLLIAATGWRAIFLINVPLGLVAAFFVLRSLPPDGVSPESRARFDVRGTLLLAAALASYTLAVTVGRGEFGTLNTVLLATAGAFTGLFVFAESRAGSPLIDLASFRDPVLSGGLLMSALVSTVMMATLVVGPFYLTDSLGLAAAAAGLVLSCGPLVAALVAAPAGRLADRFGASRMTFAGLSAIAAGCLTIAALPSSLGVAGYVLPMAVVTAGYAVFQTANNTAVMLGVDERRRGVASGMLNFSRNLGLITGASVMGAVYAWVSGAHGVNSAQPADAADGMHATFLVAALLMLGAVGVAAAAHWAERGSRADDSGDGGVAPQPAE